MARKQNVTARQHNELGVTFFQSGALDLAIEQFRKARKRAPRVATYWLNLGVALLDKAELDEAESVLMQSLKLKPQSQSAYFHLAQLYTRRGDNLSARAMYLKVIDLDSTTYLAQRARELTEGGHPHLIHGENPI